MLYNRNKGKKVRFEEMCVKINKLETVLKLNVINCHSFLFCTKITH